MLDRRTLITHGTLFAGALSIVNCTGGQIDPQKVLDTLKQACGIVVPLATVVAIINAGVGHTVQSISDLLCSGFHQALAERKLAAPLAGATVEYDVTVGDKKIHVVATKQ